MALKDRESENDSKEMNFEAMDPAEWKKQDHYEILGLSHLRYGATKEDIRKAYRRLILKYHPDKQAATGGKIPNLDDVFACIKLAYDQLWNPKKRQSYDSIDPFFDDEVPMATQSSGSKQNFFQTFGPVFERNSRWSIPQPVPQLGDDNSTYAEVDDFYSFWYRFESWREFSYEDSEDLRQGEDRYERRQMEKENKIERRQKKKEDVARIKTLVDNAYACDGRLKRFKEEERQVKKSQRKAKMAARKSLEGQGEEKSQDVLEQERLAREEKEKKAKAEADALKKENEAKKKLIKKRRKSLRDLCKAHGYYLPAAQEDERNKLKLCLSRMEDMELLCRVMASEAVDDLVHQLTGLSLEEGEKVFIECVQREKGHQA